MARPGRPERNRAPRSFLQLRRFHHGINPDKVFGTHRHSTSAFCPIVIDTPVQQDQDKTNAARMISFCLSETPADSQLILGTVSLHGVKYDGHVIETDTKNKLLRAGLFEEVSEILKPYYAKLLQ